MPGDNSQSVLPASSPEGAVSACQPQLLLLGVSHHTAAVDVREQVAVLSVRLPEVLKLLRRMPAIEECVVLSTCNRVEFYAVSSTPEAAAEDLRDLLCHLSERSPAALAPYLYRHAGEAAARHLFRVAAGLDSMILGESEVTAQVKQAYQAACAHGTAGRLLNRLFQKALHGAKLARSRTSIAEGQASIGSVIASLAREVFGEQLPSRTVLLWGAGKAAETTMRHLIKAGIGQVWVVNRTQTKAAELAALCRGRCLSWEQALGHLTHVDIAVICTQAPHYVIDAADFDTIGPRRAASPLLLVDLAVPRNVDPGIARRPGVRLYNIDDLQAQAQDGLAQRRQAVDACETLIRQQMAHFARWQQAVAPGEEVRCHVASV